MRYEVGKVYSFAKKDFDLSKETGKPFFVIAEQPKGEVYTVKPYDFQVKVKPERLECVYMGENRFEQTLKSIVTQIYVPGETYEFKIWLAKKGAMRLRDEKAGLTHDNVPIYIDKLNRFDVVKCRVVNIEGDKVELEYVGLNRPEIEKSFTIDDVLSNEYLPRRKWIEMATKILKVSFLSEIEKESTASAEWIVRAMEKMMRYIPGWIAEAPGRRLPWLDCMIDVIRLVIESEKFGSVYGANRDQLYKSRNRLGDVIQQVEAYRNAARLVVDGNAERSVVQTIDTMRCSGWIFRPRETMSNLMALINIAPELASRHSNDIFEVIKARHADNRFLEVFGDAFREILYTYIESRRELINVADRESMKDLALAIAIELLLGKDEPAAYYDRHRGMLYMLGALIREKFDADTFNGVLGTFAGLNTAPLEFGWHDLSDVNYLCYHLLNRKVALPDTTTSVFEGEKMRLALSGQRISVAPVWADDNVKSVYSCKLNGAITFNLRHTERLDAKTDLSDINLVAHRLLWDEIKRAILEKTPRTKSAKAAERSAATPAVGDMVYFQVTGKAREGRRDFDCVLRGQYEKKKAVLDLDVFYFVDFNNYQKIFYDANGSNMVLPGEVTEILPDGRPVISLTRLMRLKSASDARDDLQNRYEVLVKVSDTRNGNVRGVTDIGYCVLIDGNGERLREGDTILADLVSVNHREEDRKLYVNVRFNRFAEEESDPDDRGYAEAIGMDTMSFGTLALNDMLSHMASEVDDDEIGTAYEEDETPAASETINYISADAVYDMALLFELGSRMQHRDLVARYTFMSIACLLYTSIGEGFKVADTDCNLRLQEIISGFACNGSLDSVRAAAVLEQCVSMKAVTPDTRAKMNVVRVLSGINNVHLAESVSMKEMMADKQMCNLLALVKAFNILDGVGVEQVRADIRARILEILGCPKDEKEVYRLAVVEDLHNEFKTSIIFPAGNNMRAAESDQAEAIVKTIAAFLNSEGGTLYIGVDNLGIPRGLENDFKYLSNGSSDFDLREVQDKFLLKLQSYIKQQIGLVVDGTPLIPHYIRIGFEDMDGASICRVTVNPCEKAVVFTDGRLFVRNYGESREITGTKNVRAFITGRRVSK